VTRLHKKLLYTYCGKSYMRLLEHFATEFRMRSGGCGGEG
jgi:hypothetical protein